MRRHLPPSREDISKAFEDYLTESTDPTSGGPVEYAVHAVLEDRTITLKLTFLDDHEYCCSNPTCHLPFDQGGEWERLREILDGEGLDPARPLTLRCQAAVRPHATFDASCGNPSTPGEPVRAVFFEDRV